MSVTLTKKRDPSRPIAVTEKYIGRGSFCKDDFDFFCPIDSEDVPTLRFRTVRRPDQSHRAPGSRGVVTEVSPEIEFNRETDPIKISHRQQETQTPRITKS
jgi:hypothetical protein